MLYVYLLAADQFMSNMPIHVQCSSNAFVINIAMEYWKYTWYTTRCTVQCAIHGVIFIEHWTPLQIGCVQMGSGHKIIIIDNIYETRMNLCANSIIQYYFTMFYFFRGSSGSSLVLVGFISFSYQQIVSVQDMRSHQLCPGAIHLFIHFWKRFGCRYWPLTLYFKLLANIVHDNHFRKVF